MRNLGASSKHTAILINLEMLPAYMKFARAFWKMQTPETGTVPIMASLLPCTRGSVFHKDLCCATVFEVGVQVPCCSS